MSPMPVARNADLAGKSVLVLNWRDIRHSQAGGAEQYMHQISRRWVEAGAQVTWYTGRDHGQSAEDTIDGIRILRSGGTLAVYAHAALRLLRTRGHFDAIVDCQNGIPFFSPLFVQGGPPIVQVVHHVHQEQFSTRFSPPLAALGRFLESTGAKAAYGQRAIAAVSPSTRMELRKLGFSGPIHVVPNGSIDLPTVAGDKAADPTIAVVSRLVPHKRLELLLGQVAAAARDIPTLKLDIVGDGPERPRLQQLATDLGLDHMVTFHGYLPNQERDRLLGRAWLTASTSASEGWGCSVIEAAAWGVPCLALRVPGIRDSVVDGRTGWLVDTPKEFGAALLVALDTMADQSAARTITAQCRDWAQCFTWDRSSALLAGVVMEEVLRQRSPGLRPASDMSTLARFRMPDGVDLRTILGPTDEVRDNGAGEVTVLLKGRDEFEAFAVLQRIGVTAPELRAAGRNVLVAGPRDASTLADSADGH